MKRIPSGSIEVSLAALTAPATVDQTAQANYRNRCALFKTRGDSKLDQQFSLQPQLEPVYQFNQQNKPIKGRLL